jgi:hypothetical protein
MTDFLGGWGILLCWLCYMLGFFHAALMAANGRD